MGRSCNFDRDADPGRRKLDVEDFFISKAICSATCASAPVPDARTALDQIAGWFDDYNENQPHSGLRMRSTGEFRRAHQPAEVSG
jgi:transposase InsO family protein